MSAKVCKVCGKSRPPTGTTASPTKSKANEADGPGERQNKEKSITESVSVIESIRP